MRYQRSAALLLLFPLFLTSLLAQTPAQPVDVGASMDDWEEINFEFDYAVITDGFPSLLRLADLLRQNPGHRVQVEGHADRLGSTPYNERLGTRRAEAVKAFLVKYGASDGQITTSSQGEQAPKVEGGNPPVRFVNRRVTLTVTDDQGRTVSSGGVDEAIGVMEKLLEGQAAQQKCCEEILKRLDRLDEIANMLTKMTGESDALRKELADLRKQQEEMDAYVKGLPKALTAEQTTAIVDTRTAEQLERARMPKFSILGLNAGLDGNRDLTFTGRGRYFSTFKEQFGVQVQGEYMYFRDRQEGQMDFGLVNRFATRAQAGGFASFRRVDMRDMQSGGTLGQASATLDYLFSRGRLGIFGTKGFLNEAVLNRAAFSRNIFDETYLRIVDQWGASTTLGLAGNLYMEGNVGYLNSRGQGNKIGFTARFIQPISDRFAFTLEGGMNETLVGSGNNGRVVAGFQFGNFMPPKNYLEGYNDVQHAVPADVPRVRYELLTRRVRTGGNDPPVADGGPDQIGVAAGSITLDGSGSYDPDDDPITFRWIQIAGPSVSLTGMNSERATFTAEEGQSYSFRLTVTDDKNAQGTARVTVTTTSPEDVQIVRFQASPERIRTGQSSTIDWQVLNADTVTITEVGDVDARGGNREVTPARTTTYRLTARNRGSEATATTTIVVEEQMEPTILACQVSPMNIMAGENATIFYSVQNADEVTISGIGSVDRSGSRVVSPTETTTYQVAARNASGTANCSVTVQVTGGSVPRILRFTAAPMQISSGQASTLTWGVENATEVTISGGVGTVEATGTRDVRPTENTTYTLTARNANGEVTATSMVTVTSAPPSQDLTVTACSANPATSPRPGDPVVLSYTTTNAETISIAPGVTSPPLNGPVTVTPIANTTYVVTVTGAGRTATCSIAVTVTPGGEPVAIITGPQTIESIQRQLVLDGSGSTNPAGGALTYFWEPLSTGAAVLDQGQTQTRVQIGGLFGDYVFRLTVRNAAGQQGTTTVTVRFRSTSIF